MQWYTSNKENEKKLGRSFRVTFCYMYEVPSLHPIYPTEPAIKDVTAMTAYKLDPNLKIRI